MPNTTHGESADVMYKLLTTHDAVCVNKTIRFVIILGKLTVDGTNKNPCLIQLDIYDVP